MIRHTYLDFLITPSVTDDSSTPTNTTTISELFTTTGSLIDQIEVLVRCKRNAEKRVSTDIEVGLKIMTDRCVYRYAMIKSHCIPVHWLYFHF